MNQEPQFIYTPEPKSKIEAQRWVIGEIFDYFEMFAWSVLAVLLLFTFGFRLCRVDGESMENTLKDKETLLLYSAFYTPEQDDIIVFHLTNNTRDETKFLEEKSLVKRVIALGGQTVEINTKANEIYVDGVYYADSHSVLKNTQDLITDSYASHLFHYDYDRTTGIFKTTVPEGKLFVMGDNRNNSTDSRNTLVGFVDERCVLGKVVVRLAPFTFFS